ncbi:hypothetical protein RIF29_20425 [Crotalaria pallida]|uniref:Uncharacterized protein n=1 Tax=Crotalaria pallida TaxID=3830 RepID=A0AAN9ICD3_CROPI
MDFERFSKRPRFDLLQVRDNDSGVKLPSMLKLTPGKHILKGACSNTNCCVENFLVSSNVRYIDGSGMDCGRLGSCSKTSAGVEKFVQSRDVIPKLLKLKPGKHIMKGACSKTVAGVESFVHSSNLRMNALFANDKNLSIRRFVETFFLRDNAAGSLAQSTELHGSIFGCGNKPDTALVGGMCLDNFDINSESVLVKDCFNGSNVDDQNNTEVASGSLHGDCLQNQCETYISEDAVVFDNLADLSQASDTDVSFCADDYDILGL